MVKSTSHKNTMTCFVECEGLNFLGAPKLFSLTRNWLGLYMHILGLIFLGNLIAMLKYSQIVNRILSA